MDSKTSKKKVTTKKVSKEKIVDNKKEIKEDVKLDDISKNDKHSIFDAHFFINLLLLVALIVLFIYSMMMSFSITKNEVITYSEKSDIDYQVYIKENDFYETPYLKKGMVYIASLIDHIKINYNYAFKVSKNSDIDIKNKVVAKLVIASQSNNNIFYEKEYDLSEEATDTLIDNNTYNLSKDIDIDYAYYNNLANKFKSNYAVNTTSYLEVYLNVDESSQETNSYELRNNSKTTLTIPLSEQEINIRLNNQNVNENKQIYIDSKIIIKDYRFVVLDIIVALLIIIAVIILTRRVLRQIKGKVNYYDKYVNRLLRGYDRIIINVKTAPNLENYNIVKVENFQELIDVRDNVKEPINYYVISEHSKCAFYVINHNDLYLYTVNAIDLDGDKKDGKK